MASWCGRDKGGKAASSLQAGHTLPVAVRELRGGLVPSPMFSDSPHVSLSALPLSLLVPWLCFAVAVLLDPSVHIYHQPLVIAESFLTLPMSTHDMTLFWFSRALLGRRLEGHL